MPKDERLYARFDIGMDEHPKIMLLSDVAFRALIESTLYSRRQLTDGFLAERVAVKKWGQEAITELTSNDPERPSWVRCEKDGVAGLRIHDYEKHQTTTADIEKKRESGRLGGLAKAQRSASKGVAPASGSVEQTASTSLAKTETETETPSSTKKETPPATRGTRLDPSWLPSKEDIAKIRTECPGIDPQAEHVEFVDYWVAVPGAKGVKLDWSATWRNWMRRKQRDLKGKPTPTERATRTVMLATELLGVES